MGEIAALVVSFCWSTTSVQFTLAGRRIGSEAVNRLRLALAALFLSLTHLLLYGRLWPIYAEPFRWAWLGLSGTLGLVLGDGCLFQALLVIGPRLAVLLQTLVPVISAVVAWVLLGEALLPVEIGAILLTVSGVAWVVSEREQGPNSPIERDKRQYALGVLLGVVGALGQSLGLVAAKYGLVDDFSALSATVIRMVVAMGVIWLLALARGQAGATWRALRDKKASLFVAGGSLTGPTIGVWLSMFALQNAPVGIASTLMALSPIIMIPLAHRIFHERSSGRAIVGTVVALTGAVIIFLT
jgi:drug/metabolite transporter (DMT)-like permease